MTEFAKRDFIWKETLKIGNSGENCAKNFCKMHNIQYKKASDDENKLHGIDSYIAGVATDVKATCKIYLCKYDLTLNKLFVRHPFREKTKALNYCIIEQEPVLKLRYLGSINDYLVEHYFKSEHSLKKVKEKLQSYEGKSFRQLKKMTGDQLMLHIKQEVGFHLKPRIYCTYLSMDQATDFGSNELNVSLMTYADHQMLIKQNKSPMGF